MHARKTLALALAALAVTGGSTALAEVKASDDKRGDAKCESHPCPDLKSAVANPGIFDKTQLFYIVTQHNAVQKTRLPRIAIDTGAYRSGTLTALAIVLAVPLGLSGARNLAPHPLLYHAARRVMDLFRAVNEFVFALMFVTAVGLGPFAGMLALGIHTGGVLGKLLSETIEAIDPGQVEGVTAVGASRLHVIGFGVVPQILPNFLSHILLRFESDIRSASVIGMVGGGEGAGGALFFARPSTISRSRIEGSTTTSYLARKSPARTSASISLAWRADCFQSIARRLCTTLPLAM